MNEKEISNQAIRHVKKICKDLIKRFVPADSFKPESEPVSVFMAGSPGAGKTEFSKNLINEVSGSGRSSGVVRIDPDEFRDLLPGYNGRNSNLFQGACALAVNKVHDHVLDQNINFIMDGTFSSYEQAKMNIERSLKRKRFVVIFYLYLDPVAAWNFTKAREEVEGRNIPKGEFINKFFAARQVVNKIKNDFGGQVTLHAYERDITNNKFKQHLEIDEIDKSIPTKYTPEALGDLLQ